MCRNCMVELRIREEKWKSTLFIILTIRSTWKHLGSIHGRILATGSSDPMANVGPKNTSNSWMHALICWEQPMMYKW